MQYLNCKYCVFKFSYPFIQLAGFLVKTTCEVMYCCDPEGRLKQHSPMLKDLSWYWTLQGSTIAMYTFLVMCTL